MSDTRPIITPLLFYRDPRAALAFLEAAFGFETRLLVDDGQGGVIHSEAWLGDGQVMVVGPPSGKWASPGDLDGQRTGSVHIQLIEGVDAAYERARASGALIDREIADAAYGDRGFTCRDPEGHSWSFAQTIRVMTNEEVAKATGHEIRDKL